MEPDDFDDDFDGLPLDADEEEELCRHCGGSDDSGHAGDCPNNPYGYNYCFEEETQS